MVIMIFYIYVILYAMYIVMYDGRNEASSVAKQQVNLNLFTRAFYTRRYVRYEKYERNRWRGVHSDVIDVAFARQVYFSLPRVLN